MVDKRCPRFQGWRISQLQYLPDHVKREQVVADIDLQPLYDVTEIVQGWHGRCNRFNSRSTSPRRGYYGGSGGVSLRRKQKTRKVD